MKLTKRGFTLVEVVAVIVAVIILVLVLHGRYVYRHRHRAIMIMCRNNLKQIGTAFAQYEKTYKVAPAYSEVSAVTTTDGNLCAANLMRLYSCGLDDNLAGFRCMASKYAPPPEVANADHATVRDDPNGGKYTTYNLTTCYSMNDPANRIIVADMPFAKGCVTASAHDAEATKIDVGPNALFKDGHVTNVKSLCPVGSSEHDLSPKGNIYRVDGGEGKGKDTCILGVER